MHITRGDKVHREYVLNGMSSPQSSHYDHSVEYVDKIPQNIVVEKDARIDVVELV